MEKIGSINRIWKMSIVWTLIGCLILLLILNYQTYQNPFFLAPLCQLSHLPNTTTPTMTSNLQQTPEVKPQIAASSNITINDHTNNTTTTYLQQIPEVKPQIAASSNITISDHTTTTTSTTSSGSSSEANNHVTSGLPEKVLKSEATKKKKKKKKKKCNIFEGRWVYDPKQSPSYNTAQCPLIDTSFRCQENGRPDSDYEKWRWEATDCHVPMFSGVDMLERLRNKKMVFVGDSINKNQWQSLACLLYSSVSDPTNNVELHRGIFRAKEYNFTLEFHWSSFLIELNKAHESGNKVLVLDKIDEISRKWGGADVMVFNTAHWWIHPDSMKAWDVFEYKGHLIKKMPRELAFKRAMKTWEKWIKSNVDPKKTKIFFRSHSDAHYGKSACTKTTRPLMEVDTYESNFPKPFTKVLDNMLNGMGKWHINYLNITKLSQYRSDAHTSMYMNQLWKTKTNPIDCSHWCLPGLPDTWNRLLYAFLLFDDNSRDL